MISCTDFDGKIIPLRFRFRDNDGSIVAISVDQIITSNQKNNRFGINFECIAKQNGREKRMIVYYSLLLNKWSL